MGTIIVIIVALIVVAMLLFLLELLTPSFGIMTALGVAALGGAIWLAFAYVGSVVGIVLIGVMVFGVPTYFVTMIRLLPRLGPGRQLFLEKKGDDTAAGTPEAASNKALIGRIGVTETQLRPSGAVRIEGRRVIALAESGVIEKACSVKVVGIDGSDVIVRAVQE
ncbi:MAG TPA: NfeD family protein [Phycisphaerae bacterium]|nr:NfeD family protein [Phycisphaerae bacterium]